MNVDRKVLLQFKDKKSGLTFRLEQWFMAADHKAESIRRPALVWSDGKKGSDEHVVLLDTKSVRAMIEELKPFA